MMNETVLNEAKAPSPAPSITGILHKTTEELVATKNLLEVILNMMINDANGTPTPDEPSCIMGHLNLNMEMSSNINKLATLIRSQLD